MRRFERVAMRLIDHNEPGLRQQACEYPSDTRVRDNNVRPDSPYRGLDPRKRLQWRLGERVCRRNAVRVNFVVRGWPKHVMLLVGRGANVVQDGLGYSASDTCAHMKNSESCSWTPVT